MVQIIRSIALWHGAGSISTPRRATSSSAADARPADDVAAVIDGRRRRYLERVLASPGAEDFIEGFLASPEGRADTEWLVARLVGASPSA